MGVRFACHACGKRLNIKSELAGRRGICPACSVRFRIPAHDTETSTPIHASEAPNAPGATASQKSPVGASSEFASQSESNAQSDSGSQAAAGSPPDSRNNQPAATASPAAATSASSPVSNSSAANREHVASRQSLLDELLGGASATWYVRPSSGGQFGPADGPTLGQWIEEGRVADSAMLWRDGWPEWQVARDVLPPKQDAAPAPAEPLTSPSPARAPAPAPAPAPASPARAPAAASPARTPAATSGRASGNLPGRIPAAATSRKAPAAAAPGSRAESEAPLLTGGKVLDTNKNRVSRKRLTLSVMLGLVFVVLLTALILVLLWS
ncbi:DUF4339 domain-containing protein [Allorhodopirellula solitaria]|uniref:GYF domain-containing protein n=1 Tax=Allorhodopirellula solitaria TaxID=2527987 RepID=A0A5C5XXQ1_9BACT|nr:DUF4339 domain-containing protein [Allorhodopirellula solitaria]TWT67281.1 hypothetical protein CA85_21310 [Allorhodopirellula solitaria]